MKPEEITKALRAYEVELGEILGRFTRTRDRVSIDRDDNIRLRTIATEVIDLVRDHVPGSSHHVQLIARSYNDGYSNFYNSSSYASVQEIRAAISAVITRIERNPTLFNQATEVVGVGQSQNALLDSLINVIQRFHAVAVQLRNRHASRPSLDVSDEYDVQDLMHALLRLNFNDVRPEEWVPSYAGSSSRTDFLLPEIDTFIELKKTRKGLDARAIGEQLIIDISKYKKHPQCRRLVCFVYDPAGRVSNPAGIEADLNSGDHGIEVLVFIYPKSTG